MTFNENRSNVLRAWKLRIATISRLPGTKTFPWIARRNARSHYTAQRNDRTLPVRHKAGLEANTESSIWRKTAFLHNFTEFRPVKRDRWRAVHDKSIPSTTLNVVRTDVLSSIDRSTKSIFVHLLLGRFKGYTQFFFLCLEGTFHFGKLRKKNFTRLRMERIEARLWIILSFHCHNVFIYCLFNEREIFLQNIEKSQRISDR